MTLKDQIAHDIETVFFNTDEFAVTVLYIPKNDFARVVKGLLVSSSDLEPYVRGVENAVCEYEFKISEVTNPQHDDRFIITSDAGVEETWEFVDTHSSDGYTRKVVMEREL